MRAEKRRSLLKRKIQDIFVDLDLLEDQLHDPITFRLQNVRKHLWIADKLLDMDLKNDE